MEIKLNEATGVVTDTMGSGVAYLGGPGKNYVYSDQHGPLLAIFENDGVIRSKEYGPELGYVESDGSVHSGNRYGPIIGKVSPPHIRLKAALLLVR